MAKKDKKQKKDKGNKKKYDKKAAATLAQNDKKKKKDKKPKEAKPIKLKERPAGQFKEMFDAAKLIGTGTVWFISAIGEVMAKINRLDNGSVRINWQMDGKQIAKTTLSALLIGDDPLPTDKKKQKKAIKEIAEQSLLLTQAQLDKKYKPQAVVDALEFTQFGKKKQRKKAAKLLGEKKVKGKDINVVLEDVFGMEVHDQFSIFEFMDR